MRNEKHRLETFSFYDYTCITKHLEKMAAKGWLLDKMGNFTWRYRRITPAKLKFTVTYFPSATAFDPALPKSRGHCGSSVRGTDGN